MADKLRIAIIGAGAIAKTAHIPACRHFSDIATLAALVAPRADAVAKTAREFNIPHWFTDVETMLRAIEPHLAIICTPNAFHGRQIRLCLENGANVLCEKPLSLSENEARELFALAAEKRLELMAAQTLRFSPAIQSAKQLMEREMLGPLYFMEIDRIRRRGVPAWGGFQRRETNLGGAMCDIGVHQIDAVLWLAGNPRVTGAQAMMASPLAQSGQRICADAAADGALIGAKPVCEGFDVEEFCAGSLKLQGGAMLLFKTVWAAHLPDRSNLTLLGQRGGLEIPSLRLHGAEATIPPWKDVFADRIFSGHWHVIRNMLNACLGREAALITPDETINVTRALELIYRQPAMFGDSGTHVSR